MASLNLSTNGPSITKSYQSIVNAPPPSGPAAASPTYGQWAVFSVSAPLANAFQQDSGNKESVLKVQTTGEGELVDLVDEFSDGRIQFAFVRVKDPNSGLPKSALIAWCGEGVPERTKGYFTSHLTAVAKLLHGYHVQITARSDRDLTPDGIIQKVADASGSKYSSSSTGPPPPAATKPALASKPVFTPTQSSGTLGGYSPAARNLPAKKDVNVDEDGWGEDAPPVTRSQLEKVQPAYQPTKVNMRDLTSQKPAPSAFSSSTSDDRPDVVKGAYQPVGKVDIAAIRRQAQASGNTRDERPEIVKGAYEPVGKVDIAAIRAKAQKPDDAPSFSRPAPVSAASTGASDEPTDAPKSLAARSAAFSQGPERLTSLPKPKVANKFGGGSFTGTKAPTPGGFDSKPSVPTPVGAAGRSFADSSGKTPAQLWAEKKARERGLSGSADVPTPVSPSGFTGPMSSQKSGGEWKSGYTGKSWAPVATTHTGRSSIGQQVTGDRTSQADAEEAPSSPSGGISSIRERFSGAAPMGAPAPSGAFDRGPPPAPEPDTSNKPNRGVPIPGLSAPAAQYDEEEVETQRMPTPPPQPRSPTPPTPDMRPSSPIRVAVPVSATAPVADAHEELESPPQALPTQSLAQAVAPTAGEESDDEPSNNRDLGRAAAQTALAANLGQQAAQSAPAAAPPPAGGERARAEYEYEAAEDNEVSLREGELVTDIQKIDPDWWLVKNEAGETGLVPSNYLTLLEDEDDAGAHVAPAAVRSPSPPAAAPAAAQGATATALYDYEAGEDNELSFPENATITNVTFPDEDWWHGEYNGRQGLFPANYTKIDG
ncbi:hypothetical protein B0A52_01669 [Exophiala mesophila]|uniref:SH3 domain-containing protein n=1 Tax=Exophiala mesophila TaxID=212818 RepID=A0A438NFP2_EXOME|nr:hypothetical protein B0A52_01669 [Exophiala mesophila]